MKVRLILGALALLPVLSLSGCDDEPTCSLDAVLAGGYSDTVGWNLGGRSACGFGDPSAIDPNSSAFAFVDETKGVRQSIYILPETPQPVAGGTYPAQVLFSVAGNLWESGTGNCQVTITRFTREDWSVVDFYDIEGALVCNAPLDSASAEFQDVTITGAMTFSGHLHAEVLNFSGL